MNKDRNSDGTFKPGHRAFPLSVKSLESHRKVMVGNKLREGLAPWNKGRKNIYSKEALEKMRVARLGRVGFWGGKRRPEISREKHYNWKGGVDYKDYPVDFNRYLKDKIRERDGFKCQICGVSQLECSTKLSVHHIDGDKKNLSLKNLVSLCKKCHGKIEQGKISKPLLWTAPEWFTP